MPKAPKKLPPQTIRIPDLMWEAAQKQADREFKTPEVVLIDAIFQILSKDIDSLRAVRGAPVHQPTPLELPADLERTRPGRGTGFKGVYPHGKRYRAVFQGANLGVFDTPEEAALERYNVIRGEREGVEDEHATKQAEIDARIATDSAASLTKFFASAPRPRGADGVPRPASYDHIPATMRAQVEAHVAAGRMEYPEGWVSHEAPAAPTERPVDAAVLPEDPERALIDERARTGFGGIFRPKPS